jgi:hypothetical protein
VAKPVSYIGRPKQGHKAHPSLQGRTWRGSGSGLLAMCACMAGDHSCISASRSGTSGASAAAELSACNHGEDHDSEQQV